MYHAYFYLGYDDQEAQPNHSPPDVAHEDAPPGGEEEDAATVAEQQDNVDAATEEQNPPADGDDAEAASEVPTSPAAAAEEESETRVEQLDNDANADREAQAIEMEEMSASGGHDGVGGEGVTEADAVTLRADEETNFGTRMRETTRVSNSQTDRFLFLNIIITGNIHDDSSI